MPKPKSDKGDPWEYSLRKYLLLLATLVATVTYSAAFNPPGGVWQDTTDDHLAGDPIIRNTSYPRYLVFFYSNATAFTCSLVVIVLILILSVLHDQGKPNPPLTLHTLRGVMVLVLLGLMGAYAAATIRDALTTAFSLALLALVVAYVAANLAIASWSKEEKDNTDLERPRKVLMLLATFAVSVTYLGGLSAPGGFWDNSENGHRPGHAVLKGGQHDQRLKAFFICNTTAFVGSLLIVVLLLDKKLRDVRGPRWYLLHGFILVALSGLIAAYSAGSCREVDTTVYVNALIGAVLVTVLVMAATVKLFGAAISKTEMWKRLEKMCKDVADWVRRTRPRCLGEENQQGSQTSNANGSDQQNQHRTRTIEQARSLVLLLATLAAAITYQAGLNPPGGLWQHAGTGYKAGDPILLTKNPRRFKVFYYCNSVAFVASLVAIVLVRKNTLHRHNALEAAMILDLFGLIGAYAAGSCRDVHTSMNAMALAGVVLVYVVIHVVLFTLDHEDIHARAHDPTFLEKLKEVNDLLEKRRKRLLLFAILAATITYQAGLTPPSGFLLNADTSGNHAGDPVLLSNFPRRYKAFFYCNSVSFMLSIALIILLVNKNLYRPAIRSNALSVCTAAGMFGLVGAYAAGSTQHIKTSFYIFALAGVVLVSVAVLVIVLLVIYKRKQEEDALNNNTSPRAPNTDLVEMVRSANAATEESSAPKETDTDIESGNVQTEESSATKETGSDIEMVRSANGGTEDYSAPKETESDIEMVTSADGAAKECSVPQETGTDIERATTAEAGTKESSASNETETEKAKEKKIHAKRKYLMLLGILVASVTYQSGLQPPGGVWQDDGVGRAAGNPIMHDNNHPRYLAFFYSNSVSFVASVVVIVLLLPETLHKARWWLTVMNLTIVLDLLGLLIAYAAGSSRSWKASGYVTALVIAVLGYFVIHVVLSCFSRFCTRLAVASSASQSNGQNGVGNGIPAQTANGHNGAELPA
ncbi:hypothetical protein QOZ80_5AG0387780 [Eleusine coracana subsp. coracana]|nr:hypothetical protein QOZ80_5AG0387780 [Eleusine coracana subsp. coracana]